MKKGNIVNVQFDEVAHRYFYEGRELKGVTTAIAKKLGHEVELKNLVDARLIGGVKVVIHDHVFDGSIKYKLETLENTLKERRTD